MGKLLDTVRKRAAQKRYSLEQDPASTQLQFQNMADAEKFLLHDDAFAASQPTRSLEVLKFLGYTDAEIKDLYFKLVYEQSTQEPEKAMQKTPARVEPRMGRLIYWEGSKRCMTDPLPLEPEHETYYCTKYCFGKKDENGRFYTLIGNEWQYGGPFMSYYYDAQYDYWEVDYILEPNNTIL